MTRIYNVNTMSLKEKFALTARYIRRVWLKKSWSYGTWKLEQAWDSFKDCLYHLWAAICYLIQIPFLFIPLITWLFINNRKHWENVKESLADPAGAA